MAEPTNLANREHAQTRPITAEQLKTAITGQRREEAKPITAKQLRVVREGLEKLRPLSGGALQADEFAKVVRAVDDLSKQVGGVEVVAHCAEALHELTVPTRARARGTPNKANTAEEAKPITVEQLRMVKAGYDKLRSEIGRGLSVVSLSDFATGVMVIDGLAEEVGGMGVVAHCAEALHELRG